MNPTFQSLFQGIREIETAFAHPKRGTAVTWLQNVKIGACSAPCSSASCATRPRAMPAGQHPSSDGFVVTNRRCDESRGQSKHQITIMNRQTPPFITGFVIGLNRRGRLSPVPSPLSIINVERINGIDALHRPRSALGRAARPLGPPALARIAATPVGVGRFQFMAGRFAASDGKPVLGQRFDGPQIGLLARIA